MRKASTLLGLMGLTLLAPAATARAEEVVPMTATGVAPAPVRRLQLAVSFLPMSLGKFVTTVAGNETDSDAAFAYGGGVSVGYDVIPHLTVGFAPQAIFHVTPKEDQSIVSKEVDAFLRVAYTLQLVPSIGIYVEALPGYSIILPSMGDKPMGLVIGGGVGTVMDLGDRTFVSLGAGLQKGFQNRKEGTMTFGVHTEFYRVALSVGTRF